MSVLFAEAQDSFRANSCTSVEWIGSLAKAGQASLARRQIVLSQLVCSFHWSQLCNRVQLGKGTHV